MSIDNYYAYLFLSIPSLLLVMLKLYVLDFGGNGKDQCVAGGVPYPTLFVTFFTFKYKMKLTDKCIMSL